MFGNNPKRPALKSDGLHLEIQSIFPTLQGEGPYAGHPAIFIRLGGCNLACHFCDTEFESFTQQSLDTIIEQVQTYNPHRSIKLIVITGGEPLRQPLIPLCTKLIALNYKIQIETNGTFYQPLPKEVDIICSPKPVNGRYYPIRDDLLKRITAFKFIISSSDSTYQAIGAVGQEHYNTPIYVQPMDEHDLLKNAAHTKFTLDLALKHGYYFSLQIHKVLGIQ